MKPVARVNFSLTLPAVFTSDGDWVIGSFPNLDVVSQGRDRVEAERNLIEAAQLFIESCFERNVLEEVLKQCGFAPDHSEHSQLELDDDSQLPHLTVPVDLLAARKYAAAAAN